MKFTSLRWCLVFVLGMSFLTSCKLQRDPEITGVSAGSFCGANISYVDHAPDGSKAFLSRSNDGTHYFDIKIANSKGEEAAAFFDEGLLPNGTYYYRVGYFNPDEVRYSEVSDPVVIDEEICGTDPLVNKPINPILHYVLVEAECDAAIWMSTYAEEYDGLRIYRRSLEYTAAVIAELTQQEFENTPGVFYDLGLPPGVYQYRASVYNKLGESFSEWSEEITISPEDCPIPFATPADPITLSPIDIPAVSTSLPSLVIASLTPTSVPKLQECTWEALINVFLRKGPDIELFDRAAAVEQGTQLPVVGQSEFDNFWILEFQPGMQGYVSKSESVGKTSGDCADVPVLKDPPAPVVVATKTPKESGGGTGVSECSDGIDNDNDGWADMRDLAGCSSPTDPVED